MSDRYAPGILTQHAGKMVHELARLKSACSNASIHDTRVQSRRMRTALEICHDLLSPNAYKSLHRDVRKITRLLGRPREAAVTLKLLRRLTNIGDPAEESCRKHLVERMEKRQKKLERRLQKNLASFDPRRLQLQIKSVLRNLAPSDGGSEPMASKPEAAYAAFPSDLVAEPTQLDLFQMNDSIRDRAIRFFGEVAGPIVDFKPRWHFHRATDDTLHQLRISAKRLRYAMEMCAAFSPQAMKREIECARALQDAGGSYHDWCALCEYLRDEIRRMHKENSEALAFQTGRLLARAEDIKKQFRSSLLAPINNLQSALVQLLPGIGKAPAMGNSLQIARNKRERKAIEGSQRRLRQNA